MIIVDVRTRTKSGDVIRIGTCRAIHAEPHQGTLTIAEPLNYAKLPVGSEPFNATVRTFTAEIVPYVGRPGGYLLVQPTDPVQWIPGWSPIP